MIEAMLVGISNILTISGLGLMFAGILVGLCFGVIPGISGTTALVILFPFIPLVEPSTALLLFIGVSAVVTTANATTAILIGVPGTPSAAATIIDGYAMARQGQATRALGAAYTSSVLGGIIGTLFLLVTITVSRQLVMLLGPPELLMLALMGLSTVGVISGRSLLIGLALAAFGLLLGQIGMHPQTGIYRWSFGIPYLTGGLAIQPVILGLFGLAEIADLAITENVISTEIQYGGKGIWDGVKDTFRHWFLVLRASLIGVMVGVVPGIGASLAAWLGYGHAAQTSKTNQNFGGGDVRGVIAPEAANNACMGGAFLPTMAFGVPGSSEMILYLAAFTMLGILPGPDIFTKHLGLVFTITWGTAIASILGYLLCMAMVKQLAKICLIPTRILVPVVIALIFIGALRVSVSMWDLYTVIIFGILGYGLKRLGWPRPPLILGFVLSPVIGKYLFISVSAYGANWLMRPGVIAIGLATIAIIVYSSKVMRKTRIEQ
jgi:putative tricarboxylic transport membrane protein